MSVEVPAPPADLSRAAVDSAHDDSDATAVEPLHSEAASGALDDTPLRHTVAVLCPVAAVGALCGAIFTGVVVPSIVGVAAGVFGGLVAYSLRRSRNLWLTLLGLAGGILVIGLAAAVATGGPGVLGQLTHDVDDAVASARLLRPPIDMTAGSAAMLGWIMAAVGVCAVWTAVIVRKPAIGMMLPLMVAVIVAISLPDELKLAAGIALLVMFGIGLGVLSGDRRGTGSDRLPLGFELRRGARALPFLAIASGGVVLLAHAGFLFPTPVISPQLQAQRPHTAPISAVPDKVLFTVQSVVTGPWVVGVLDVYDGADWLLPPISDAQLVDLPSNGVVNPALKAGVIATFTISGLGGAVLPTLPDTVAIIASGPKLDYDARSGNIRLVDGQVPNGFVYKVAAASTPQLTDVEKDNATAPSNVQNAFTEIPPAPRAVQSLLQQAPKTSKWAEFDFLRTWVLKNVTAAGAGDPVSVTPDRAQQIIGVTKVASPFEIVALQAMLGRWMGLPSRIGYGFDGGVKTGDVLEVHPRDGASFPEVYFSKSGWLPVIGTPAHAQQSQTSNPQYQQSDPGVQPSTDIATPLFLPIALPPPFQWYTVVQDVVAIAVTLALALLLIYLVIPVVRKALVRYRRRAAARRSGPRARIVEAYAEWRDTLTDYGYEHPADTPLMLVRRFARDDEHSQLAWLVTRAMWGDMQDETSDSLASDAEELSRALQRRLAQAHPLSVRLVAAVSRRSLRSRHPADIPGPDDTHDKEDGRAA